MSDKAVVSRALTALCVRAALFVSTLLIASTSFTMAAQAEWPERRINLIVPFAAGGGADPVARLIADDMSKRLGQPVTVEFRPGANATIGTNAVARARPDGYTLLLTSPAPITNAKHQIPDLAYDPQRDLIPIIHIADSPMSLISNARFPARDFNEFVAYTRQNPDKATVAIPGVGGLGHQAAALLAHKTGIKVTYVPYSGTGSIMADLLGGQVNASTGFPAAFLGAINDGRLRGLVLLSDKRMDELPDMPSIAESGYPQAQISAWYALFAPKGTPHDIVAKVAKSVGEYLSTDTARERFKAFGYRVTGFDAKKTADVIARDTAAFIELYDAGLMNLQ
jgi:tripartite-type tricarboxylate transporter receptor subunit TctC